MDKGSLVVEGHIFHSHVANLWFFLCMCLGHLWDLVEAEVMRILY